jgi:cyclophilin family peptidyl-prolyl cis-trans isomerase
MVRIATCQTTMGTFKVELYDEQMPITVGNFIDLADGGFYDG